MRLLVRTQQLGAQHSKDSGDVSGFQEEPPITLCDSPVNTVESFGFLGIIITQDLK